MYHSNKFFTTNTVLRRRNYCYADNLAQSGIESREIFTIDHMKGKVSSNRVLLKLLTTKIELENLMLNSTFLIFYLPCYSPSDRSFPLLSKVAFRIFIHNPTCLCHNFFFSSDNCPFSARPTNNIFTKYKINLARHIEYILFGVENISCEQFAWIFSDCTHLKPPLCM